MLSANLGRSMACVLLSSLFIWITLWSGCGKTELTVSPDQAEPPTQEIEDIVAKEASELIQENKDNPLFVILDVRTPEEFSEGHIESATNVDYNSETFREKLDQLDKDKTYLMHCRSGARSSKALPIMAELGFLKIYHMTDGIDGWKAGGFPVVPSP